MTSKTHHRCHTRCRMLTKLIRNTPCMSNSTSCTSNWYINRGTWKGLLRSSLRGRSTYPVGSLAYILRRLVDNNKRLLFLSPSNANHFQFSLISQLAFITLGSGGALLPLIKDLAKTIINNGTFTLLPGQEIPLEATNLIQQYNQQHTEAPIVPNNE